MFASRKNENRKKKKISWLLPARSSRGGGRSAGLGAAGELGWELPAKLRGGGRPAGLGAAGDVFTRGREAGDGLGAAGEVARGREAEVFQMGIGSMYKDGSLASSFVSENIFRVMGIGLLCCVIFRFAWSWSAKEFSLGHDLRRSSRLGRGLRRSSNGSGLWSGKGKECCVIFRFAWSWSAKEFSLGSWSAKEFKWLRSVVWEGEGVLCDLQIRLVVVCEGVLAWVVVCEGVQMAQVCGLGRGRKRGKAAENARNNKDQNGAFKFTKRLNKRKLSVAHYNVRDVAQYIKTVYIYIYTYTI